MISLLLVLLGIAFVPLGLALCVMAMIVAGMALLTFFAEGHLGIAVVMFFVGIAALMGGFLLIALSDRVLRKRIALGYCSRCGYDLRGSPGPRCPECGAER